MRKRPRPERGHLERERRSALDGCELQASHRRDQVSRRGEEPDADLAVDHYHPRADGLRFGLQHDAPLECSRHAHDAVVEEGAELKRRVECTGAQREVREARSPTEVRGGAARAVDADAAELREAWAVAEATREETA